MRRAVDGRATCTWRHSLTSACKSCAHSIGPLCVDWCTITIWYRMFPSNRYFLCAFGQACVFDGKWWRDMIINPKLKGSRNFSAKSNKSFSPFGRAKQSNQKVTTASKKKHRGWKRVFAAGWTKTPFDLEVEVTPGPIKDHMRTWLSYKSYSKRTIVMPNHKEVRCCFRTIFSAWVMQLGSLQSQAFILFSFLRRWRLPRWIIPCHIWYITSVDVKEIVEDWREFRHPIALLSQRLHRCLAL